MIIHFGDSIKEKENNKENVNRIYCVAVMCARSSKNVSSNGDTSRAGAREREPNRREKKAFAFSKCNVKCKKHNISSASLNQCNEL